MNGVIFWMCNYNYIAIVAEGVCDAQEHADSKGLGEWHIHSHLL